MSNNYKVMQTPLSEKDLACILGYIDKDNPDAAFKLLLEFEKSFKRLKSFPFSGNLQRMEYL